ncbi:uncharacterized protein LOC110091988, partial [Dendrobium catenatum]|uniref:uncharacterized protein LOC110091988 n=1 Tax=Dendrobium catenatum TaxID=906689 RepID=UPI0009F46AA3
MSAGNVRRNYSAVTCDRNGSDSPIPSDWQVEPASLQELNNRFIELNIKMLLCMACLNPNNGFHAFNKDKLIRMTQFYPTDFSLLDQAIFENQLDTYIMDMRSDDLFTSLKDVGSLAKKMIQ